MFKRMYQEWRLTAAFGASYMLDYRGKTQIRNAYSQSHLPILQQDEAVGHAVRVGYMYAGIADVAALTQDSDYIRTIDRIWQNIVGKKYYITGGVGARHEGEAFGDNYELPNLTAYNETCAAISMVYLNERMFLLHGESKYIDCIERTLYNGGISGMKAIATDAQVLEETDGGKVDVKSQKLTLIPYYAWNHRGAGEMNVWFVQSLSLLDR